MWGGGDGSGKEGMLHPTWPWKIPEIQSLPALPGKDSFLKSNLNLSFFSLKPSPPCPQPESFAP